MGPKSNSRSSQHVDGRRKRRGAPPATLTTPEGSEQDVSSALSIAALVDAVRANWNSVAGCEAKPKTELSSSEGRERTAPRRPGVALAGAGWRLGRRARGAGGGLFCCFVGALSSAAQAQRLWRVNAQRSPASRPNAVVPSSQGLRCALPCFLWHSMMKGTGPRRQKEQHRAQRAQIACIAHTNQHSRSTAPSPLKPDAVIMAAHRRGVPAPLGAFARAR